MLVVLWSSFYLSLMKTVCLHIQTHTEYQPAAHTVSLPLPSVAAAVTLPPPRLCHFVFGFLFPLFIFPLLYFLLHPLPLPLSLRCSSSLTLCVFCQSDTGAQRFDLTHHFDSHNCLGKRKQIPEPDINGLSCFFFLAIFFLSFFFRHFSGPAHTQASTCLLSTKSWSGYTMKYVKS